MTTISISDPCKRASVWVPAIFVRTHYQNRWKGDYLYVVKLLPRKETLDRFEWWLQPEILKQAALERLVILLEQNWNVSFNMENDNRDRLELNLKVLENPPYDEIPELNKYKTNKEEYSGGFYNGTLDVYEGFYKAKFYYTDIDVVPKGQA